MTKFWQPWAVLFLIAFSPLSVVGDTINWVGYQYGPPQIPPTSASWFHGDQWFNYNVPDADDHAVFDSSFDPQGNGTPDTVYFGDFTVLPDPPGVPSSIEVPGGDAVVQQLSVQGGHFTFRFTDDTGMPQGSLTVLEGIGVGDDESVSLTLVKGNVAAEYASLSSSGGTAKITLNDATLATNPNGLFDVGVGGTRGAVYVGGDSLLQTGYLRVGENGGSNGLLEIVGSEARAEINGAQIGATGTGRVEIRNGGRLDSSSWLALANFGATAEGSVIVSDAGSTLQVAQNLVVGDSGDGELVVENGANSTIGWNAFVGNIGQGTLIVRTGGTMQGASGYLGLQANSVGNAEVSDAESAWSLSNSLFVGQDGTADLIAKNNGLVSVAGLLQIGALGSVDVSANGIVNVGSGDTPAPGTLRVGPGGTLAGSGEIVGNVLLDGGGIIPGLSPGALKITGNYQHSAGSLLTMEIAGTAPGTEYDQLLVSGNLSVAGPIQLWFINGFLPQVGDVFNLFSAGGDFVPPSMLDFLNAPAGFDYTTGFDNGVFSLTVTAVPEPTTVLQAILLFVALSLTSRRSSSGARGRNRR